MTKSKITPFQGFHFLDNPDPQGVALGCHIAALWASATSFPLPEGANDFGYIRTIQR
jgi:hypothetical protein